MAFLCASPSSVTTATNALTSPTRHVGSVWCLLLTKRLRRLDVKGMIEDDVKTEYVLRKERKLRKGLLMGPLGTLVIEAAQPKSARLPPTNAELGYTRVETSVTIMLRFEPAKGVKQLPRLYSLTSKLKSRTYYATSPCHDLPKKADGEFDASKGMHGCNIELASPAVGKFDWRLEEADAASQPSSRRDGTASIEGKRWIPARSSTYTPGSAFFTTKMIVPIELPNTKHFFVPTFHSCLISRTYTIALSLSLQTAGPSGSVDPRIPMQVSAAPPTDYEDDGARRRESVSSAVMNTDVEDDISSFFAPRSLANPAAAPAPRGTASPPYARNRQLERRGTLDAPPPGYTDRESSRAVRTTMHLDNTVIPDALCPLVAERRLGIGFSGTIERAPMTACDHFPFFLRLATPRNDTTNGLTIHCSSFCLLSFLFGQHQRSRLRAFCFDSGGGWELWWMGTTCRFS